MKKKVLNIALICTVLLVWGYVYKVVFNPFETTNELAIQSPHDKVNEDTSTILAYKLHMAYSDPFKMRKRVVKNMRVQPKVKKKLATRKKFPINVWPSINLKGTVISTSGMEKVAILSVSNKTYRVIELDTINALLIRKIWNDSVLVCYHKENRVIKD